MYGLAKIACAFHWIFGIFKVFSSYSAEYDEIVLTAVQLGSAIVSLTVFVIACKFIPRLSGFFLFWGTGVRIAATFLLFHLISEGVEGFEKIDPK